MPLDFQVTQHPFRFGLAEGTDPSQVQPGVLTTAENVVWKKSGRLEKRLGTSQLATSIIGGGSVAAAKRLFCRGPELCLVDGTSLYAYSPTFASWKSIGKVPNVGITSTTLTDSVMGVAACDTALSAAGLRVDAWLTLGTSSNSALVVQVVDASDGTLLVLPTVVVAGTRNCYGVRVVITGTTALVATQAVASTAITVVSINLATLAVAASVDIRTDVNAGPGLGGWDICLIGSNMVLAYTNGATAVKLYSYNASLVQQATGGITGETTGADLISIDGASGEVLYVLYRKGALATPVKIAIADPSTLAQTVAPVTIEAPGAILASQVAVCRYDATHCIAAYTVADATGNVRVTSYQVTSAAVVTSNTERGTYGTAMLTRPFMLGGSCYMGLSEQARGSASSPTDRSSNLVEVEVVARTTAYTPHRYLGTVDVLIGGSLNTNVPASAAVQSSTSVFVPMPFQSTTNKAVVRQGMRLANLTLGAALPSDMWRAASVVPDGFVICGVLSAYDGRSLFDYGFPRGPVFMTLTPAGGGSIAAGVYLYGSTLEYRSATGLLYRSPTQTAGGTVTSGAAGQVTVVVDGFNLGNKQTISAGFGTSAAVQSLIAWYRTTVGGTVYQRLSVEPTYNTTFADQTAGTVSFVDSRGDADITGVGPALATRPTLYTTGGILDDYAPPAGVSLSYHVDRLWVLAGDQKTWWYSKAFQDDLGVAPGFHPNLRISFAETQVAMASMDDKAIFFSATGVKYMLGTGPAPSGLNSDFQTPTTIQSDVGCSSARSVVTTPDGVMFLSDRGLYLLTRGLELVWIGRPVKDTLASFPVVTSAVLVAKQNQVRFTCTDSGGTTGRTLVYDYVEKQWATYKHWVGGVYGGAIADACVWNGAWTFVSAAGVVYSETTTSNLDASGSYYVPVTIETAWISGPQSSLSPSAGPLKFQSVRSFSLHGISNTDHDLTIQAAFDTNSSYQQTATFLAQSPVTTVGPLEECNMTIGTRRKCGSIRFKVTDATPTTGTIGTGQGPSFDMMALEVGMKRGLGNTPAVKKG